MKKFTTLVLALVMMLSVTAFAEGIPSKTTDKFIDFKDAKAEDGNELPADLMIDVTEPTEEANNELENISEFVEEGKSVYEYFADIIDDEDEIISKLPEGLDPATLEMNEFAPLIVENYDSAIGDIEVTADFATQYKVGQAIVAMVGVDSDGDGKVEWFALEATVVESDTVEGDTDVIIYYTQEVLEKINGKKAMLAILSEPATK